VNISGARLNITVAHERHDLVRRVTRLSHPCAESVPHSVKPRAFDPCLLLTPKQIEPPLLDADFSNVDVEIPDGILRELFFAGLSLIWGKRLIP
jgi:hypothetical protein